MRTLYISCNMGAAGDMLTAALLELHPNQEDFLHRFQQIGLEGVTTTAQKVMKCGVKGTHVTVTIDGQEEESLDFHHEHGGHDHAHTGHDHAHTGHDHGHAGHDHEHAGHDHDHTHHYEAQYHNEVYHDEHQQEQHHVHTHHHSSMEDIRHQIEQLQIEEVIKKDVLAVYEIIAKAESIVHDTTVSEIHFHEVGTKDALADIVAVSMLMHELQVERVICSPIHVGSGQVKCAHGILPVPAPATALILMGIPTYGGKVKGELCTPTGAALLKHFADEFGSQPVMRVGKIGYGCGKKEFEQANCVRAFLGETQDSKDEIVELQCNLDDTTPENIAFAMELLMKEGALDVYTIPIGMKKNRTGILLTCMCRQEDHEKMLSLIFKHTTTLGIREYKSNRYVLTRSFEEFDTKYGKIQVKKASGYGVQRQKLEYEDLARIAREQNCSIEEVRSFLLREIETLS